MAARTPLEPLMSVAEMAEHLGRSKSTVYKMSCGAIPSIYPEPVRVNGRVRGWRREDVRRAEETHRYSRADYLYEKA
ncbi:helix-turn-helix domain-containing protein [Bifidobacterium amazonense]|uniref:Helix-turn-helix domain-containing protein n=1 Tax=Bifidobacterium amazonense TaxID=2809027 RepID=A0ABS9VSC3_9BIFI|nr:helix-turn-helix domain-containing protein [Bifidobacterium amazonense]MCH9274972.1 helix-turn-helix domain-containing protein [Bifidobacterium amazonense]